MGKYIEIYFQYKPSNVQNVVNLANLSVIHKQYYFVHESL
jgi:hypothetical protein